MNNQYNDVSISAKDTDQAGLRQFFVKVYLWMTIALGITFITANSIKLQTAEAIFQHGSKFLVFIVLIGLTWAVQFTAQRNPMLSVTLFAAFAFVMGVLLAIPIQLAQPGTAMVAFLSTGLISGLMSLIGFITKKDLSSWYRVLLIGLIGIIISDVVLYFVVNSAFALIVNTFSAVIFSILLIVDTNQIKRMYHASSRGSDSDLGLVILGAMALFMDIINLFMTILDMLNSNND